MKKKKKRKKETNATAKIKYIFKFENVLVTNKKHF